MRKSASGLALGLAVAVAAGLLPPGTAEAAPLPSDAKYVAIGSSYAAGTSLSRQAEDSPARCGQGTENYPRQVARALQLQLVDRSCGGAVMRDVLQGGQYGLPAQVDAVDADTRLVTITAGGNDVRFVADLGRFSCGNRSEEVPAAVRANACAAPPDFREDEAFALLEKNFSDLLMQIRSRAPQARIVVVDYVTVVPASGTCATLAMSNAETSIMRARAARLAALTAKLAKEARADLIAASSLSRTHDVCSADAWVWGFVPNFDPAKAQAIPFHPRPAAIAAVANAIIQRLQQ